MKNSAKIFSFVIALVMVLSMAACSGANSAPTEAAPEAKQQTYVLVVMTEQHAYFQNVIRQWENLAKEHNFKLTVMDPNFDNSKLEKIVEDIIALKPDGVAFCPLDGTIGISQVKKMTDAGIAVVPYNLVPTEIQGPSVAGDDYNGGVLAGVNSAKLWKEKHSDVEPVVGIISAIGYTQITARVNGFVDGFKSVYPGFQPVAEGDGKGQRIVALKVAEDMLQAHPEINILYGTNDDSGLGALDALKEINRGTIDKALVAAIDGSEAAMLEVKDPQSAFKVDIGNPPVEMADLTYQTLISVKAGSLKEKIALPVTYIYIPVDQVDTWLAKEFPTQK